MMRKTLTLSMFMLVTNLKTGEHNPYTENVHDRDKPYTEHVHDGDNPYTELVHDGDKP